MILLPLDLSHQDESNGGKIIQIGSLDAELLFVEVSKYNSAKIKVKFWPNIFVIRN